MKRTKIKALAGALLASTILGGCETMPDGIKDNLGNISALTVGLAAYAVCDNNSDSETLCALVALAGAAAGKMLGDEIARNLTEKEQRLALEEASRAISSGEPRVLALPDSGGTLTITPSGDTVTKTVQASVLADANAVGGLEGTFQVASPKTRAPETSVSIHTQPDSASTIVDTVTETDNLHVFGGPENSDWVLVGYRAYDDLLGTSAPVAIGYVPASSLPREISSDSTEDLKPIEGGSMPESVQTVELDWVTTCDTATGFELTKSDGSQVSETSETCIGPGFDTLSG